MVELSEKIQDNVSAGKDAFDGLDQFEALLICSDVQCEELFDLIKDRLKVESGVTVSGGATSERGDVEFV